MVCAIIVFNEGRREQVMDMAREEEAITERFNNYVQTFQTLDPKATLPYFHVPCMFIPPDGVRVLATAADVEALLTQVMQGLKARSFARSQLTELHVKPMSGNIALVSVSSGPVRYRWTGTGALGGNLHIVQD
jgi:hypothetical protein